MAKAADYAASRPNYPGALFDALRDRGALSDGAVIVDIGAGTGLLTREMLRRGHAVTAVEPNAAMRATADAQLSSHSSYRSIAATAEATTLTDHSIDLITVAQAFHWFDVATVRSEWLRILKPSGQVVLIWNTRPLEDPLQHAIDEILGEFGETRHTALSVKQSRSAISRFFAGAPFEELDFPHRQWLDRTGFLSLVRSRSAMPARATSAGQRAHCAVSNLFNLYARADHVTLNYRTVAFVGRPNPAPAANVPAP